MKNCHTNVFNTNRSEPVHLKMLAFLANGDTNTNKSPLKEASIKVIHQKCSHMDEREETAPVILGSETFGIKWRLSGQGCLCPSK